MGSRIFLFLLALMQANEMNAQYKKRLGFEVDGSIGIQKNRLHPIFAARVSGAAGITMHFPIVWHRLHVFTGLTMMPQRTSGDWAQRAELIRTRCLYAGLNAGIEYRMSLLHQGRQLAFFTNYCQAYNLSEYNVWNTIPIGGFPAVWARSFNQTSLGLRFYSRLGNRERKIQVSLDGTHYKKVGEKMKMQLTGFTITLGVLKLDAPKKKISEKNKIYRTLSGRASPD
jgi:hypothetical protein